MNYPPVYKIFLGCECPFEFPPDSSEFYSSYTTVLQGKLRDIHLHISPSDSRGRLYLNHQHWRLKGKQKDSSRMCQPFFPIVANSQDKEPSVATNTLSSISQLHYGKSERELRKPWSLIRWCHDSFPRLVPLTTWHVKRWSIGNWWADTGDWFIKPPIFLLSWRCRKPKTTFPRLLCN